MTWEELRNEWEGDSETITCHTSGSTGKPRLIMLPKHQVRRSAQRTINHFGLHSGSHLHSCISPDFIGGKMMLIRALIAGAEFSAEQPSNSPLLNYKGSRIDLLSIVPSQMYSLLERIDDLPEIGAILIGGAPIPDNLRKIISAHKINVWESYGMTETASHIALRRVCEPEEAFAPLPGIDIELSDNDCLKIDINGWQSITTNDLAQLNDDSTFKIIGRADNTFISGGIKIHPEELERILNPYFNFNFMISSKSDNLWGNRCVMIVENSDLSDDLLLSKCREILGHRIAPKEIIHGNIPLTKNGKILRK